MVILLGFSFATMLEDTDSEPEADEKAANIKDRRISITKRRRAKNTTTYLKEDYDTIVDFLDPKSTIKAVTGDKVTLIITFKKILFG